MNNVLYAVYNGHVYELEFTLDNDKYRLFENILNKRVITSNQLDVIHGKKFNAYIVSFDLDNAIEKYTQYIHGCIFRLESELNELKNLVDVTY